MKYKILTKDFLEWKYSVERLSTREIAKLIGCSGMEILYYLKKYNIPRRTISEANKGEKHPFYGRVSEKNPNWKGGRIKDKVGYIYICSPKHPYRNNRNYVYEHRLVVEKYLGRYLTPKEQVHHINGIKDDNRIENLMVFASNSAHIRFHINSNNVKPEEIIFNGGKQKCLL